MLKKIAEKAKGRHSKKHGKQKKLIEKKIANHIPLSKTEKESRVLKKFIK